MQIERTRGDTAPIAAAISFQKNRRVVNISGCSFKLTVDARAKPSDSSTMIFQVDGIIKDAELGQVEFFLTEDQSNNVGYFYYDIQMTDAYGKIATLVSDSYVCSQDITK